MTLGESNPLTKQKAAHIPTGGFHNHPKNLLNPFNPGSIYSN
jgi:hypothetical protein